PPAPGAVPHPPGAGGAMSGLVVEGLSVERGRWRVLDRVSLGLAPGEIVAVIGPNGAGKSSLLEAILGFLPVAAGRVTFEGRARDRPARAGARRATRRLRPAPARGRARGTARARPRRHGPPAERPPDVGRREDCVARARARRRADGGLRPARGAARARRAGGRIA